MDLRTTESIRNKKLHDTPGSAESQDARNLLLHPCTQGCSPIQAPSSKKPAVERANHLSSTNMFVPYLPNLLLGQSVPSAIRRPLLLSGKSDLLFVPSERINPGWKY